MPECSLFSVISNDVTLPKTSEVIPFSETLSEKKSVSGADTVSDN